MKETICACSLFLGGAILTAANNITEYINYCGVLICLIGLLLMTKNAFLKKAKLVIMSRSIRVSKCSRCECPAV